jgi:CubicO group peptidase (beta-lactamase class C family)
MRGIHRVLLLAAALMPSGCHRPVGSAPRFDAAPVPRHFPPNDSLETLIRALVDSGSALGVVLGVVEADGSRRIVWRGSAGANARPLGPRSVFELGSITKVFTATLLAEMVAAGRVALADPVARYLPPGTPVPARNGREITLVDLATHHSALPQLPGNMRPADRANPAADYSVEQLYAFLAGHELRREVGAQFEYSTLGFGLLGHALARAAGGTYEDVVRTRVLQPLGMRMTGVRRTGDLADWMTEGHDARGNVVRRLDSGEALAGGGALRSNAEDLLTFLWANIGDPRSRLQRAMRDTHVRRRDASAQLGVGLGWSIRSVAGRTIVSHTGGTAGFRGFIGFDPERRVGLVLLANSATDNAPHNRLALDLLAPAGAPR